MWEGAVSAKDFCCIHIVLLNVIPFPPPVVPARTTSSASSSDADHRYVAPPASRGATPPPPWFCLTQQRRRPAAHRAAAPQCLTKSPPPKGRGGIPCCCYGVSDGVHPPSNAGAANFTISVSSVRVPLAPPWGPWPFLPSCGGGTSFPSPFVCLPRRFSSARPSPPLRYSPAPPSSPWKIKVRPSRSPASLQPPRPRTPPTTGTYAPSLIRGGSGRPGTARRGR